MAQTDTSELGRRLDSLSATKRQLLEKALRGEASRCEPIAVVGLGCRFAGAASTQAFWNLLCEGRVATGPVPPSRWDAEAFYDPSGQVPGKMASRWGGFVEGVDQFDPLFFGISPREAENMDPQQRLLLEVAWEALEHGAIAPRRLAGTRAGVFVGIGAADYSRIPARMEGYFERINLYSGTGNALSIAANRLSYVLDLRGPSLSVDTACSSALVAVHLAVQSLRKGECDAALAGGCNLILSPESTLAFSKAQMLSPDGVCRPFDAHANGYVRGEGCGILVLKRLSQAEADGNRVFAVIRGTAVNQDGRTSGIAAPNPLAQQAVIRAALDDAGVSPADVTYVEAHGTATPLGDPMEWEALGKVFRQEPAATSPCSVGSVKANIGHTETAAGAAGLIKIVLMMQHGQIPPQATFERLNPRISLSGTRLAVAGQLRQWQPGGPRIAGISSFGFGGTNAHLVVEQASQPELRPTRDDRPYHVLTLSAKTETALAEQARQLAGYLDEHREVSLGDVCFSRASGRSHFEHRLAIVAQDHRQLQQRLAASGASERAPDVHRGRRVTVGRARVAFLFSGQGCQYSVMGRRLFETEPVFRDALRRCDELFEDALDFPLLALLHQESHGPRLHQTRYLQPALFAIQYALAELWRSWGIVPDVVVGHSVGEFAAACVAQVMDVEDASQLVAERARLMSELPHNGAMAVVFADEATVARKLTPYCGDVCVAALNGPENTVISGTAELIERVIAEFGLAGVRTQKLSVSHAFHSSLMEPMLEPFRSCAEMLDYQAARIPFISTVTGEPLEEAVADGEYWVRQVRSPVQFMKAVRRMAEYEPEIVVEIGPSGTAIGMAQGCPSPLQPVWLPSLKKGNDDSRVILGSLAEMYVRGVEVDWESHGRPWPRQRLVLPTYPFQRKRYWHPGVMRSGTAAVPVISGASLHPLLGARVPTAAMQHIFAAPLGSRNPAYLADHQVRGSAVMPAAGYVELGLAVGACQLGDGPQQLESLSIQQAMVLTADSQRSVQTLVTPEARDIHRFDVYSRQAHEEEVEGDDAPGWVLHASGTLRSAGFAPETADPPPVEVDEVIGKATHRVAGDEFYDRLAQHGLVYGRAFRVIEELYVAGGSALASLAVSPSAGEVDPYHVHPTLLDGGLQTIAGLLAAGSADSSGAVLYLPTFVRRTRVFRRAAAPAWAYAVRTTTDAPGNADVVEADVFLLDDAGKVLVELAGVCLQRVGPAGTVKPRELSDWIYTLEWLETVEPRASNGSGGGRETDAGRWLVFADARGVGARVADLLCRRGGTCALVRPGGGFRRLEGDGAMPGPHYEIDPVSRSDYEKLLTQWRPTDQSRCGILHLWNLDLDNRDLAPSGGSDAALPMEVRARGCGSLLQLLHGLLAAGPSVPPSLFLVTRGAQHVRQGDVVSPGQSASWGMARVAANEHPEFAWHMIDLDPHSEPAIAGDHLRRELFAEHQEDQIAYRGKQRWVARLRRDPRAIHFGPSEKRPRAPDGPRRLQVGGAGTFDSLCYTPLERRAPGPGQVEVEVHSAGLNFSDVLKAMGLYPGITDRVVPMGIECSGIVSAVGEGVGRFSVGDPVMGVAPYSFASHAVTAEYALTEKPHSLSHGEAATIPIAFLTAYYGLRRLARLAAGERVLVHAGAGGVGLAAIQIAQHVGAEIFATAGSDEKRDFLRSLGLAQVMNSRTLEFADQVMTITGGRGVDVVLNSLPGSAIDKSLSVLGAYGRFLEIGKVDIYRNRMIGLLPFQNNLSYFAIDLDRMLRQRPDEIRGLLAEVMEHFRGKRYRPLPVTCFRDDEIRDAFRYMAQRKNIGKVIVSFRGGDSAAGEALPRPATIRGDGTYLITGGLGAVGLHVARQLAGRGAGFIVLVGRHEPSQAAAGEIQDLRDSGVHIAVLRGDVADRPSLDAALQRIPSSYPPLRGVFHAAGVLADSLLHRMDLETLDKALAPKIAGAWNLHRATMHCELDHFVLFSSVAGILGSPGQANYAAGNSFLDGLAHYRRAKGLPAVSISWGPLRLDPFAGGGMAAQVETRLQARGMSLLRAEDALQLLESVWEGAAPHVVIADVDWNALIGGSRSTGPTLVRHLRQEDNQNGPCAEVDEAFCRQLREAKPDRRLTLLGDCIAEEVATVMEIEARALDRDQPLAALGLDSLMAMELKAKLETKLGRSMPVAALMENPSVLRLAELFAPHFSGVESSGEDEAPAREVPTPAPSRVGSWSPLLKLTARGDGPPLICLHPAGGDVSCYYSLARRLESRFPVWTLRARGLDEQTVPHESVEQMAQDYLEVIRAQQPPSPYFLAGWSTGGIFAYAMARQLLSQGSDVGGLFLFDSPTPAIFQGVDLDDASRFLVDLVEFSNWFAGSRMRVDYEQLKSQTPEAALQTVFDEARRHHVLPPESSIEYLRRLVSVCREHSRAIVQYPLRPLERPVHLFRPTNSSVLASAAGKTLSDDLGWREILGEQLTIHEVPGDHFSMMTEANAHVLSYRLLDQLEGLKV